MACKFEDVHVHPLEARGQLRVSSTEIVFIIFETGSFPSWSSSARHWLKIKSCRDFPTSTFQSLGSQACQACVYGFWGSWFEPHACEASTFPDELSSSLGFDIYIWGFVCCI